MDDRLLKLRRLSYELAITYHRSMSDCVRALLEGDKADAAVLAKYNQDAAKYGVALVRLLQHLQTLPPSNANEEEIGRTRKVLDLLDRECDLANERFALIAD